MPSPTSRVVKNGSKIRVRFEWSMPWPVSATESSTAPARAIEPRRDRETTQRPAAHRLLGVEHEVEERLLQLAAVDDARAAGRRRTRSRARCCSGGTRRSAATARVRRDRRRPAARAPPSGAARTPAGCGRCWQRVRTPRRCAGDPGRLRRSGADTSPDRHSLSSSCAKPMTLVSGLLSSCATPATSWPIADSFSAWSSCACVDFSRSRVAVSWPFAFASSSLSACSRRAMRVSSVTFLATWTTDAPVRQPVGRERRHAEDLLAGQRDLGAFRAFLQQRPADRARRAAAAAEPDLVARDARQFRDRTFQQRRQRGVAAQQLAALVEDRDRIADRVERPLPLLLAAADRVVQPRVLHRDDDLAGNQRQQTLVGEVEAARTRRAETENADERAAGDERQADAAAKRQVRAHGRRLLHLEVFDDDGGARRDDLIARARHPKHPRTPAGAAGRRGRRLRSGRSARRAAESTRRPRRRP